MLEIVWGGSKARVDERCSASALRDWTGMGDRERKVDSAEEYVDHLNVNLGKNYRKEATET